MLNNRERIRTNRKKASKAAKESEKRTQNARDGNKANTQRAAGVTGREELKNIYTDEVIALIKDQDMGGKHGLPKHIPEAGTEQMKECRAAIAQVLLTGPMPYPKNTTYTKVGTGQPNIQEISDPQLKLSAM